MRIEYARHIVSTVRGGVLGLGTLWISGYLDELTEAEKTLKRHADRKRREAKRNLQKKRKAKR